MNGAPPREKPHVTVHRWLTIADRERLLPALERIFFESSGKKNFSSDAERQAFLERWIGRYLTCDPDWVYVALNCEGELSGYLVGCLEDPAKTSRFADIGYFKDFAALTESYPAHLHVNIAPAWRNQGLGSQLIDTFLVDAARTGAPGVHVVTGAESRNIRFYESNGFHVLGRTNSNARDVVFLGRSLQDGKTA